MFERSAKSYCASTELNILLDGAPVRLPPGRRSLSGIRSYLETLALEQKRVLCSFSIDGIPATVSRPLQNATAFRRVEGKTFDLEDVPLQLIRSALEQSEQARASVLSAINLVLINNAEIGREVWWNLTRKLKLPLMTLSLLPEDCAGANLGCASPTRLRSWQLEQLGKILKDVEEVSWSPQAGALANAMETRVLPWLENLVSFLELLHETTLARARSSELFKTFEGRGF